MSGVTDVDTIAIDMELVGVIKSTETEDEERDADKLESEDELLLCDDSLGVTVEDNECEEGEEEEGAKVSGVELEGTKVEDAKAVDANVEGAVGDVSEVEVADTTRVEPVGEELTAGILDN